MKRFLLPLLFFLPLAAQAEMPAWVSKIDYLQAEDRHSVSRVWSGYFKALNGDAYDVSHMYRSKRPQFNLRTAYTVKETPRLRLSLPLHYDQGYRADLYEATPYLGLGFIGQWAAGENLVLGLHIHDGLQSGGKITEHPCHDGFQRAFHCGTGLPWTDAEDLLRERQIEPSGKITLNWRF